MDAASGTAAHHHHQDGFAARVGFIVLEAGVDAEARTDDPAASVALLARIDGGDQTVALQGRFDGPRIVVEDHSGKLAGSSHLRRKPACRAGRNVAGCAGHLLVRREKMGGELGLHDVAALSAELGGFHVLDGAIGDLASDDQVRHGHDGEEQAGAAPGGRAIDGRVQRFGSPVSSERDADGNQDQSREKYDGDGDEREQSDVGVADIPANVRRQCKEPREAGQRDQRDARHGDPVAGEQNDDGLLLWIGALQFPLFWAFRYAIRFAISGPPKRGHAMPLVFIWSSICGP